MLSEMAGVCLELLNFDGRQIYTALAFKFNGILWSTCIPRVVTRHRLLQEGDQFGRSEKGAGLTLTCEREKFTGWLGNEFFSFYFIVHENAANKR